MGIGLRVAQMLASQNVPLVLADVDREALAHAVQTSLPGVGSVYMDVANPDSVAQGVEEAVQHMGGLDMLINAAGVIELTPFPRISVAEWDRILTINLRGTFLTIKATLPHLQTSSQGCIVNIASDAGKRGFPYIAHYVASKFGVVGLTQALAVELGPMGIRVNAVCPSTIPATGMGRKVLAQKISLGWGGTSPAEILERGAKSFPVRRLGTVDDVAHAVIFLLSDQASWISGESINVDGGALSG